MDSVSDFESGGCGFESRRSCLRSLDGATPSPRRATMVRLVDGVTPPPRRTTPHKIWTDWKSEGSGFDSRVGLPRNGLLQDSVAEWLRR